MMIDPNFRLPVMPVDIPYNAGGTRIIIIVMSIMAAAALAYSIREYVRTKSFIPLALVLGSVFICITEVFVDIMGCVYYPTSPDDIAFTIMGRQMGWFIVAGWTGYGAVVINLFYKIFNSGKSALVIWIGIAAAALLEIVLEEIITSFNLYVYYGNQPLVLIHNLPWWWIPCNVGGAFLAACMAFKLKEILNGWKAFIMVIIVPCVMGAAYALIALPSWIVVNGEYSPVVTQLAGIFTVALGFLAFSAEIYIFTGKNPFDLKPVKQKR